MSQIQISQQQTQSPTSTFDFYLRTGVLGAIRGFMGLPFEHPFDVLKTRLQAASAIQKKYKNRPEFQEFTSSSMIKNWVQIYQQQGLFRGIYAGYLPSLVRVMTKQFYRFPMMVYFPNQFRNMYSEETMKKYDGIHKISAGLIIACLETILICPLERIKVSLMTKCQTQLLNFGEQSIIRSLYQGLDALFYRQITSWVSFLYLDYKVKKEYKILKGIDMNQSLNDLDLVTCSAIIGISNVMIVQPFDKIKTLLQMNGSDKYKNQSLWSVFNQTLKREGVKGIYAGSRPRMVHYVINSIFTCSILEKLEINVINKINNN